MIRHRLRPGLIAVVLLSAASATADDKTFLQWFETRFENIERRMPDFFLAGYDAVWVPPVSRGLDPNNTAGFDVFDRFDLGRPGFETTYGTESDFRALVDSFHRASSEVYVDLIMNHCSVRDGSVSFQNAGGYPGFWLNPDSPPNPKGPADDWGDFHDGSQQSEDEGAPNFDLFAGDLVSLCDIAQESNHQFIRQPVDPCDPLNIPGGTVFNTVDPANTRFYPDLSLPGEKFTNPGAHGNIGGTFTIHPFSSNPADGDPVPENATGLLLRHTQWLMDEFELDGYRLDAAKHIPNWFWDSFWDNAVHMRRTTPGGTRVNPYSFVESVAGNGFTYGNYVRLDSFAQRDALDLAGAGAMRDVLNSGGFGTWQNVLSAHIDNADDGFNNGTVGVNHLFSHDNGTTGDGGSAPPAPTVRQQAYMLHAYLLTRTGNAIVYHNAGEFRGGNRSFYPREGVPIALGAQTDGTPDDTITNLVRLRREVCRGTLQVLNGTDPVNQSLDDVLIIERRGTGGTGNALIGVNDRWDSGVDFRSVATGFPAGTRLHEMSGNAADPGVDPFDQVADVLVVDGSQRVLLPIPRNNSGAAGDHGKGFVVYAPALPTGTLSLTGISSTLAADGAGVPSYGRRLASVPVVTGDFAIQLSTSQTDPSDGNTDDLAVFRIDAGYRDLNGNGGVDYGEGDAAVPGYENFVSTSMPLYNSGNANGTYAQDITAADLDEGLHYLSVVAFRHRPAGTDPLFREFRQVFYVDRTPPPIALSIVPGSDELNPLFSIEAGDTTTSEVYLLVDVPGGTDPVTLIGPASRADSHDRFAWRGTLAGLPAGLHEATAVALEETGTAGVATLTFVIPGCPGDVNGDAMVNLTDLAQLLSNFGIGGATLADGDVDQDGDVDLSDLALLLAQFGTKC